MYDIENGSRFTYVNSKIYLCKCKMIEQLVDYKTSSWTMSRVSVVGFPVCEATRAVSFIIWSSNLSLCFLGSCLQAAIY